MMDKHTHRKETTKILVVLLEPNKPNQVELVTTMSMYL